MSRPRQQRAIVPGVSIWPQPKPNPRESYKISFGPRGKRKTVTASPDLDATIELAVKLSKQRERTRLGLSAPIEDRWAAEDIRPTAEHLEDYRQYLIHEGREKKHIRQMHDYARDILLGTPIAIDPKKNRGGKYVKLDGIRAARISDIVPSRVMKQVAKVKGERSLATSNRYLDAINGFLNWGVQDTRWERNVCAHLVKANADTDRRRVRRAIDLAEFGKLITAAEAGDVHSGLTGYQRGLIYRTCVVTAQRANEVRQMLVQDLKLEQIQPGVWIQAAVGKNRKRLFIPIPPALAEELKLAAAGKSPSDPVLNVPANTARMLKHDLKAAGIPYETADGFFDFHAIRHQCGALLISAGVNPKAVQQHMRHSTIKLTLDTYGHVLPDDRSKTVDSLPTFQSQSAKPAPIDKTVLCATGGQIVGSENRIAESHSANRGSIPRRSNPESRLSANRTTLPATHDDCKRPSTTQSRLRMRRAPVYGHARGRVLVRVLRAIRTAIADEARLLVATLLSSSAGAAKGEA